MTHLTFVHRYTIEVMLTERISKSLIASRLNLDKCTVYRELNRNSDQRNNVYRSKTTCLSEGFV